MIKSENFLTFLGTSFNYPEVAVKILCMLLIEEIRISESVYTAAEEIDNAITTHTLNTVIESNDKKIMILTQEAVFRNSVNSFVLRNKDKLHRNMTRSDLFELWFSSLKDFEITLDDKTKFMENFGRIEMPNVINDQEIINFYCHNEYDIQAMSKNIISKCEVLATFLMACRLKDKTDSLYKSLLVMPNHTHVDDYKTIMADEYKNLSEQEMKIANFAEMSEMVISQDNVGRNSKAITEMHNTALGSIVPMKIGNIDQFMKGGGAEATRLYLWAAVSGGGKSLFLVNVTANTFKEVCSKPKEKFAKKNLVLHITLENKLYETLERLLSCMTEQPLEKIIDNGIDYTMSEMQKICSTPDTDLIVKYFPRLTSVELGLYLTGLMSQYNVRSVTIDYLDILKHQGMDGDQFWRAIGDLCRELKILATTTDASIHTASQLGRSGINADRLSNAMISEGIKKIDNADVVMLLNRKDDSPVYSVTISKNRNYRTGDFYTQVNWDLYKLYPTNPPDDAGTSNNWSSRNNNQGGGHSPSAPPTSNSSSFVENMSVDDDLFM